MTVTEAPTTVEVAPVAGVIGAEIRGVDLREPLSEQQIADIRAALLKWKVIFFRDQHIGPAEQIRFGGYFGEVTPAHPTLPSIDGYPEVLLIGASTYNEDLEEESEFSWGAIENHFHTDVTFVHNPPLGSILRAVDVPPYSGDTGWSNLVAAYDSLSAPVQRLIDPLRAVHRNEIHVERGDDRGTKLRQKFTSSAYQSIHPVVRVHPETGEKALFVNPNFTSHIVGVRNRESRRLLELLYEAISDQRNTVRFHWEPGSIAFWDNRATAHLAAFDYVPTTGARNLHRITLAGDVPVGPDGFTSEALEGGLFS